jgi:hypothetical protein
MRPFRHIFIVLLVMLYLYTLLFGEFFLVGLIAYWSFGKAYAYCRFKSWVRHSGFSALRALLLIQSFCVSNFQLGHTYRARWIQQWCRHNQLPRSFCRPLDCSSNEDVSVSHQQPVTSFYSLLLACYAKLSIFDLHIFHYYRISWKRGSS